MCDCECDCEEDSWIPPPDTWRDKLRRIKWKAITAFKLALYFGTFKLAYRKWYKHRKSMAALAALVKKHYLPAITENIYTPSPIYKMLMKESDHDMHS